MTERLLQMCTGLVTSLAVPCVSAAPVKVAEGAGAAYYVVSESVRDARPLRSVAVIHDYAQPEPGGVRSRRVVYDVECSGERLRSVAATEHPGPMGEGQPLNAWQGESEWLYVAPPTGTNIARRSHYRAIVRFVCSR